MFLDAEKAKLKDKKKREDISSNNSLRNRQKYWGFEAIGDLIIPINDYCTMFLFS